ncbi:MAG: ABC transporter permease, partial [Marinobacter sp.]|nr:ABC transporter permease [Marinobacter sp.]
MSTATASPWNRFRESFLWYSFKRDKIAIVSFVVFVLIVAAGYLAPWLAPQNPYDLAQINIMNSELPPIWMEGADPAFPLGTDAQGRDLLSTILYGTRVSLLIGFGAVLLQSLLGILFGLLAGYMGGRVDSILMRVADVQLSFSTLMVAIIVGAVFKASFGNLMFGEIAVYMLILIIGVAEWPQIARTVRASVLAEKKKEYVEAARVMGFRTNRIMFRHILPNTLSPIFV